MYILLNGIELEIKTNLRLANRLQENFKKPYIKVLETINTSEARIEDQLKFLYLGYELGGGALSQEEFQNILLDNLGVSKILNYLEQMITELQYPGMTESEIEEELKKKIAKIKRLSSTENT